MTSPPPGLSPVFPKALPAPSAEEPGDWWGLVERSRKADAARAAEADKPRKASRRPSRRPKPKAKRPSARAARTAARREAELRLFAEAGDRELTRAEVAAAVGCGGETARVDLDALLREGRVRRRREGRGGRKGGGWRWLYRSATADAPVRVSPPRHDSVLWPI